MEVLGASGAYQGDNLEHEEQNSYRIQKLRGFVW
jgi:hypothetical protein